MSCPPVPPTRRVRRQGSGRSMAVEWREGCSTPTREITREQALWLLKHTIVCSVVCAGVNFAISYLSFHGEEDPTLWYFPTPISGSFAVTLGLELTLNWLINCPLMTLEVINGKVPPLDARDKWWWPKSPKYRWWLNGSDLVINPNKNEPLSCMKRLNIHSTRAIPWGIASFFLTWPVSVFICWILWGNDHYNDYPLPEILIAVYGVLLVVVTLPFWGLMILADLGDRLSDPTTDPLTIRQKHEVGNPFATIP